MRGVYTTQYEMTATTAKTLLLLIAPSTAVLEILSVQVSNLDNETNEQWSIGLYNVTSGSGTGTALNFEKHEALDSNASATGKGDLSAEPTYSSYPVDKQGISSLGGYRYDPIPEERPIVKPSGAIGLRLLANVTSTTITASIVFREIG